MPQVVIKSKVKKQCPKCPEIINDGEPVAILLGEWMHVECKAASLAAKRQRPVEVPSKPHYEQIQRIRLKQTYGKPKKDAFG